jgi:uncharacterized protein (DUF433 family)
VRGEDVVIERYGTPRAALVEYGRYQQLVEAERERVAAQTAATQPASPVQLHEAAVAYHAARSLTPGDAQIPADHAVACAPTYRYVTRTPGVCGGRPILRGTRVAVRAVVGYHKLGLSVDETLAALPHLTPAQVYEALSYYYDHVDEIEQEIRENQLASLIERYGLQVAADGRITFVG